MSQRINISVPDELYEKMQTFKDQLNISKICQKAITRSISIEEIRSQTGEEVEKLAAVYRKEIEIYGENFKEEGFRDGTRDAFEHDFNWMNTVWLSRDFEAEEFFELGASKESRRKVGDHEYETSDTLSVHKFSKKFYLEGWVKGHIDVLERVMEKLSTDES